MRNPSLRARVAGELTRGKKGERASACLMSSLSIAPTSRSRRETLTGTERQEADPDLRGLEDEERLTDVDRRPRSRQRHG